MINWHRFVEVIRAHQRYLLVSHIRPDADALGSELGMAGVLESLGKQVLIVNAQATPPNLRFLDPDKKIKTLGVDIRPEDLAAIEVLMVLDTSAWAQLGEMGSVLKSTKAKKIVLDHHMSADDLGAEEFKDTKAEATGRLVVDAARQLGVKLTPVISTPLFAAVATDTGWFRFPSTTGGTFRCGGELLDAGTVPATIYKQLYEQDTLARLHLIGRVLARVETELDGRLIYTSVLQEDFTATGAIPSDTEDVINMTLQVGGTETALIFVELAAGGVKVSFRSRGTVECNRVAELFGGGGHKAAAGATLQEPLEAVQKRVLEAVRAAMK